MNVHLDVSVQMTLGYGTKFPQITYLTAPCQRSRRDDQNGHLVTQFGVRMEKLRLRENHRRGPVKPAGLT